MTLYDIDIKIKNAIDLGCDPETGEIIDDAALEQLQMDREEKIENCCLLYKNLCAEAAAIKAEEESLAKRRKPIENHAKWLKTYVQNSLDGEKFKTARCETRYTRTQAVEVDDLDQIPKEYLRVKKEADRTAIKAILKNGGIVAGAHLEDRQSMSIK